MQSKNLFDNIATSLKKIQFYQHAKFRNPTAEEAFALFLELAGYIKIKQSNKAMGEKDYFLIRSKKNKEHRYCFDFYSVVFNDDGSFKEFE